MTGLQIVIGVVTVVQGGAVAILVWVFRRVIRGELVARSVLEDVRKDRDDRIAEAKATTAIWIQAYNTSAAQVSQLLELGRTSEAVLRSLPRSPDREPQ